MGIKEGFFITAFMEAVRLAAVPPEKVPCIRSDSTLYSRGGFPKSFSHSCWVMKTPRSKGMESKPLEKQICAPIFLFY